MCRNLTIQHLDMTHPPPPPLYSIRMCAVVAAVSEYLQHDFLRLLKYFLKTQRTFLFFFPPTSSKIVAFKCSPCCCSSFLPTGRLSLNQTYTCWRDVVTTPPCVAEAHHVFLLFPHPPTPRLNALARRKYLNCILTH